MFGAVYRSRMNWIISLTRGLKWRPSSTAVSRKNLKPGDLVFFTTYEPGASHVGIYAGNNLFWNATSSRGIMLSNLTDSYWGPRYYTARRILTGNDRSR